MLETDLIKLLPRLYHLPTIPMTIYEIVNHIKMQKCKRNYEKIKECHIMGFLEKVNSDPDRYVVKKDKIWNAWKETNIGEDIINMIDDEVELPLKDFM